MYFLHSNRFETNANRRSIADKVSMHPGKSAIKIHWSSMSMLSYGMKCAQHWHSLRKVAKLLESTQCFHGKKWSHPWSFLWDVDFWPSFSSNSKAQGMSMTELIVQLCRKGFAHRKWRAMRSTVVVLMQKEFAFVNASINSLKNSARNLW